MPASQNAQARRMSAGAVGVVSGLGKTVVTRSTVTSLYALRKLEEHVQTTQSVATLRP
jgi:hypothetical protein